jgi:hypothetical protein
MELGMIEGLVLVAVAVVEERFLMLIREEEDRFRWFGAKLVILR